MGLMHRGLPLLALVLLASSAFAQEAPPPPPDPTPGLREDPNIDRAWFSPTAVTQPKGSFSFNDYELVFLGATYGVTDNFQLSVAFFPPLTTDLPFLGLLSGKLGFPVSDRVRLAASFSVAHVSEDEDEVTIGILGAALSVCTDDPCASLFSAYAYGGFAFGEDDDSVPLVFGASLVQRLARHVKLVLDVGTAAIVGEGTDELADGLLVSYGVRFFSDNIAGDIGFARPIFFSDDEEDFEFILGVPVATFTYRF